MSVSAATINDDWHNANADFLTERMDWLRQRLHACINEPGSPETAAPPTPDYQAGFEPALLTLASNLGLSDFEQQVLLLASSIEFDRQLGALCAQANGDPSQPFPTFALAAALFPNAAWDSISPLRPLRRFELVEIQNQSGTPTTGSPLRADERIVHYVKGLNYPDERLLAFARPLESICCDLPDSQERTVTEVLGAIRPLKPLSVLPRIQLLGGNFKCKRQVAGKVADRLGLRLFELPAELLPSDRDGQESLLRVWERESLLLPIALYVSASDTQESQEPQLCRFVDRAAGLVFVDRLEPLARVSSQSVPVAVEKPSVSEQRELWTKLLPDSTPALVNNVAANFSFDVETIRAIATDDSSAAGMQSETNHEEGRIWERCCSASRQPLKSLAHRVTCKASWKDLVLPEIQEKQLREICSQIQHRTTVYEDWGFGRKMNRGLGLSVLFAGESGTGKSMAAEVIANELRLDLHRIDLSQVVNKYIGETEKNLRRLFDAADNGGTILFFDEADALFGKRTDVKDSHDRFANIETNYLLQRIRIISRFGNPGDEP